MYSWSFVGTNSPYENICEVLQRIFGCIIVCVDGWNNLTPVIIDFMSCFED